MRLALWFNNDCGPLVVCWSARGAGRAVEASAGSQQRGCARCELCSLTFALSKHVASVVGFICVKIYIEQSLACCYSWPAGSSKCRKGATSAGLTASL